MKFIKNTPIYLIKFYQVTLSYFIGGNCRFYPSCSNYAIECFNNYNFSEATVLTAKRICRCHPFSAHHQLYDPVPLKNSTSFQSSHLTGFELDNSQKGSI